jgi:hypothetical protein
VKEGQKDEAQKSMSRKKESMCLKDGVLLLSTGSLS